MGAYAAELNRGRLEAVGEDDWIPVELVRARDRLCIVRLVSPLARPGKPKLGAGARVRVAREHVRASSSKRAWRSTGRGRASWLRLALAKLPVIDRVRLATLVVRAQQGDEGARREVVTGCLRMVGALGERYAGLPGVEHGDLVAEGSIGVSLAIDKCDPSRAATFLAYSHFWVVNRMVRYLSRASVVRTSSRALPVVSLDAPISDESGTTRLDLLVAEGPSPEDLAVASDERRTAAEFVRAQLDRLEPRERMIVRARLMSDEVPALGDVGRALGLSGERVRQIERQAVEKLRRRLSSAQAHRDRHGVQSRPSAQTREHVV